MIYHSLMSNMHVMYQDDPRNKELVGIRFELDSNLKVWFKGSHDDPH